MSGNMKVSNSYWNYPNSHLALVTGACGGIGSQIATDLSAQGMPLVLVSRSESRLHSLVSKLAIYGNKISFFTVDFLQDSACIELFHRLEQENLHPDILINCFGGVFGTGDSETTDNIRKMMRVNLEVAMELNLLLVPNMSKKSWGRIINFGSVSATTGSNSLPYALSKSALESYTRFAAARLAKMSPGVVMSAVSPGAVSVPGKYLHSLQEKKSTELDIWLQINRVNAGRLATVEEISALVLFLASEVATYMHGSVIQVNGSTL